MCQMQFLQPASQLAMQLDVIHVEHAMMSIINLAHQGRYRILLAAEVLEACKVHYCASICTYKSRHLILLGATSTRCTCSWLPMSRKCHISATFLGFRSIFCIDVSLTQSHHTESY